MMWEKRPVIAPRLVLRKYLVPFLLWYFSRKYEKRKVWLRTEQERIDGEHGLKNGAGEKGATCGKSARRIQRTLSGNFWLVEPVCAEWDRMRNSHPGCALFAAVPPAKKRSAFLVIAR